MRVDEPREQDPADALHRGARVTRQHAAGGADVHDGAGLVDDHGAVAEGLRVAGDDGVGVESAHGEPRRGA